MNITTPKHVRFSVPHTDHTPHSDSRIRPSNDHDRTHQQPRPGRPTVHDNDNQQLETSHEYDTMKAVASAVTISIVSYLQYSLVAVKQERDRLLAQLEATGPVSPTIPTCEANYGDPLTSRLFDSAVASANILIFIFVFGGVVVFLKSEYDVAHRNTSRVRDDTAIERVHGTNFSFSEFMFYRMDYFFSSFTAAKPVALLLATYVLIVFGAISFCAVTGVSIEESMWRSWTFVADPGTHADEEHGPARFVALVLTLGGMLIFAVMIGVVAESVSDLLDDLKQGKSRVIESGHTLILGWSDKVLPTIRELAIANESEGGGVIVVMADREKQDMERELREAFSSNDLLGTIVICRTGSSILVTDLNKVSAHSAKSVIVLADPSETADASDAKVVRAVMSLIGLGIQCHIVVEMCDIDNRELVLLVGYNQVETIVAHDIIGRLMIQCARQPGLAQILERILGFSGDEFYLREWENLYPKPGSGVVPRVTFNEVCFRFDQAVPVGVKPKDLEYAAQQLQELGYRQLDKDGKLTWKKSKRIVLNPPGGYVLQPGDQILVIAEDDDTYELADGFASPEAEHACSQIKNEQRRNVGHLVERLLFCGWRRDMDDMIMELDKLVSKGSELTLLCAVPVEERKKRLVEGGLDVNKLKNLKLIHRMGNPVLRKHLETLDLHLFGSILILADEAVESNMQTADSRSLASLLLIRDIVSNSKSVTSPDAHNQVRNGNESPRRRSDSSIPPPLPIERKRSYSDDLLLKKRGHSSRGDRGCDADLGKRQATVQQIPPGSPRRKSIAGGDAGIQDVLSDTVVISEILDSRTKSLISIAHVSDYVMSNEIVACSMAMVSEDPIINSVLGELLSAEGNELHVRSCLEYCEEGELLTFWDMLARSRERYEVAIGYKPVNDAAAVINPRDKSTTREWRRGDLLIVVSA